MINCWNRSGDGKGDKIRKLEEGEGDGHEYEYQDDDDRTNFLQGNHTPMLYYWHQAKKNHWKI